MQPNQCAPYFPGDCEAEEVVSKTRWNLVKLQRKSPNSVYITGRTYSRFSWYLDVALNIVAYKYRNIRDH